MLKRSLTTAVAAVTLALAAGQAQAANPHDGAWSSVESQSYWSDGKLPKGFKLTINLAFGDNKLEYHSVNTTMPGKEFKTDYLTTLDGTPAIFENQDRFNQVSVKQLGPDEFQILKMKDGDVIVGEFWTFRPDGKTLVRRGVGKSPEGRSKAYQETFVRQ
ncbi:hypothetical protein LJR225_004591 [Phenylobacterium sp. LjRoot225]|uniref:hypothetical protein n=1 Tax=Phenylobacterium sp. LjRoot225 TaxID=3342285 RepID=UPI003ECDB891